MKFILTIDLGNEAMQTSADLADALGYVMSAVVGLDLAEENGKNIRDRNGNTVGSWKLRDYEAATA